MLTRRSLLKKLGAALVAAPALAVTASSTAEAATSDAAADLQAMSRDLMASYRDGEVAGYQRGYDVATARAESRQSWAEIRSSEGAEALRLVDHWLQTPEGQSEILRQAHEYMGYPSYRIEPMTIVPVMGKVEPVYSVPWSELTPGQRQLRLAAERIGA